jgi:glycosyltransferase involved in cell wall biosynthesis
MKKILIIGPVLPYRGGIAQHTTMLHRALLEENRCLTISFKRQYPRFLFPGKSDKDLSLGAHQETNVEYLIDSLNPLTWEKAVNRAREYMPDIVIFPWWHVYWSPCFIWLAYKLRKRNAEIVFLCHNVVEHESAKWKQFITRFTFSFADRFIVHTSEDKRNLLDQIDSASVAVYPMPVFNHFPQPSQVLPRRAELELLFFGFVRPYKGLSVLLNAMKLIQEADVHLSIVGEFWKGKKETFDYIQRSELWNKIEVVSQYITDEEAANYFARCDVVVLPYLSATGSAVIPVAYHYHKPVIATQVGGIPDVVREGQTGILINPNSPQELAEAILSFNNIRTIFKPDNFAGFNFSWGGLAEIVLDA